MQEFVVCKLSETTLNCFCVSSVCYKQGCVMRSPEASLVENVNGVVGAAAVEAA